MVTLFFLPLLGSGPSFKRNSHGKEKKGDNQGKEKKRLHACYCFYVEGIPKQKEKGYQDYHPSDDHGHPSGDNQGKEKKRLHACAEKGYQDYHPSDDHACYCFSILSEGKDKSLLYPLKEGVRIF